MSSSSKATMKDNRPVWEILCRSGDGRMPRYKLHIILLFAFINFFGAICISLQAPFYPEEAERKGASAIQYSLVFAAFQFAMLLTSPFASACVPVIGSKNMTRIGVFITSISCIAFGFVKMIEDSTTFIAVSIIIRMVEGFGEAQFFVSLFAILCQEFKESVASTFAFFTTCWSVGMMIGPTIGGFLYDYGGFTAPFVAMGGCLFIIAMITFVIMGRKYIYQDDGNAELNFSFFSILRLPGVITSCLCVVSASFSIGFIQTTLQQHLEELKVSTLTVGLLFSLSSIFYIVFSPVWGWLCDRGLRAHFCMLLGSILYTLSFFLIGPPPFLSLQNTLWINIICLALIGVALSCHFVSGFIGIQREAMKHGYKKDLVTYSSSSGLWSASNSLGACIGATTTGILHQTIGFSYASLSVMGFHMLVFVITLIYILVSQRFRSYFNRIGEKEPLLGSSSSSSSSSCGVTSSSDSVLTEEVF